jgi:hypothetical protein
MKRTRRLRRLLKRAIRETLEGWSRFIDARPTTGIGPLPTAL